MAGKSVEGRQVVKDALASLDKPKTNGEDKPKRELKQKSMPSAPISAPTNFFDSFQYLVEIIGLSTLITHSKKGVHIGEGGQLPKGKNRPPFDIIGAFKDALYLLPGAKMPTQKIEPNGFWPYFPNRFGLWAKAFKMSLITVLGEETQLHPKFLERHISATGFGSKDPNMFAIKYDQMKCRYEHLPNPSSWPKTLMPVSRPEFFGWSTKIIMRIPTRLILPDQFGRFMTLAGETVGVGDSRKEKSGYEVGTFGVGKIMVQKICATAVNYQEGA
jgi:hypothetical protein